MDSVEEDQHTRELFSVDGLATSAVVLSEVASLKHELRDDAVEARSLVTKAVYPSCKLAEVLRCFRDDIVIQLEFDTASGRAVDGNIKLDREHQQCSKSQAKWVSRR